MQRKKAKAPPPKPRQQSNVSKWVEKETPRRQKALETASRHFDHSDNMDVHTLEAVYAQESSFGLRRGKRNSDGAAGDFQLKKSTARSLGLHVSAANDERFNIDAASAAAAKYLKNSDEHFREATTLTGELKTTSVKDREERKNFVLAAYNAGEARIAKAQVQALQAGKDPTKWDDVKWYLEKAGATKAQADETRGYVDNILKYEREFGQKSKADASEKDRTGDPIDPYPSGGHWITKGGRHIFIKD